MLVSAAERQGTSSLSPTELERLPLLYRAAASSLAVARSISLDRHLVDYLQSLTARGYVCVYGVKRRLGTVLFDLLWRRFPAEVRRMRNCLMLAVGAFLLGAIPGFALTLSDPDYYYTFVGDMAQDRTPATETSELRAGLYDQTDFSDSLATFASSLFSHNARIGLLAFALGFLAGIPTLLIMFRNGLVLGSFAALYHSRGLSVSLWGWLLPHGVTELLAMLLAGAAGLAIGRAVVFPGRRTRLQNMARAGRAAGVVAFGVVVLDMGAALIEGFFRQMVVDDVARYALAINTAVLWFLFFNLAGRKS